MTKFCHNGWQIARPPKVKVAAFIAEKFRLAKCLFFRPWRWPESGAYPGIDPMLEVSHPSPLFLCSDSTSDPEDLHF